MKRFVISLVLLGLTTLACSMSGNEAPTTTPFAFGGIQPTATTQILVITNTPSNTSVPATNTPFASSGSGSSGSSGSTCRVRTDWYTYTVQRGDTLSGIARNVGSDTTTLTQANCLTNPNSLEVGQVLRVPRLPLATATPAPTFTPLPNTTISGMVVFNPIVMEVGTDVTLAPSKTVTISYPEAVASLQQVVFYLTSPNGAVSSPIGTDNNMADGASMQWTVPAQLGGERIHAVGFTNGNPAQMSNPRRVYAAAVQEGTISVSSWINAEGEAYNMQPGATVTVTYVGASATVNRVEFNLFNPITDGWTTIGADTNLSDGASVSWTIPYGLSGHLIYVSTYNGGTQLQTANKGYFYSVNQPNDNGVVEIFPFEDLGYASYTLKTGQTVNLIWSAMPQGASRVDFYYTPNGGTGAIIASDTNWQDGAFTQWVVPSGLAGHVTAIATMSNGTQIQATLNTQVVSN